MGRRGLFGSVVLVGGSIVEVDIVLIGGRSGHGTRPGADRRTAYHAASRGGTRGTAHRGPDAGTAGSTFTGTGATTGQGQHQ